jgi:hypothetical protein
VNAIEQIRAESALDEGVRGNYKHTRVTVKTLAALLDVVVAAKAYRGVSADVMARTAAGVHLDLANAHGVARRRLDDALAKLEASVDA